MTWGEVKRQVEEELNVKDTDKLDHIITMLNNERPRLVKREFRPGVFAIITSDMAPKHPAKMMEVG